MGPLEKYCTIQLCDLSKVPALCVDISSDGKLMATGSGWKIEYLGFGFWWHPENSFRS
jgi:hypothetical protein